VAEDGLIRGVPVAVPALMRGFGGFKGEPNWMIGATVINGISNTFVWFLYTLYLDELMYAPSAIGIALMMMGLAQTVPLLPAGYLGDRFGRKRMIVIGVLLNAVGALAIIKADFFVEFCAGGIVWGLGHSFYAPAFIALMSEKVEEKRRKYLFSLQAFAGMVSGGVAILIAGFFPELLSDIFDTSVAEGFRMTFWIGLACIFSQLLFIVPLSEERKYGMKEEDEGGRRTGAECPPIPWHTLLLLCSPMVMLGIGAGLIVPFFQLYFQWRFDTPVHVIGMLFSLTQLLWGLAYLIMPYFADRVGSVKAITIVQWIAIGALVGIPLSPSFHFVALMFLIRMVVMNSTWPILQSYSLSRVPREHRSFTLSATNFCFNLPKGIAPGIAGFIYAVNLELPFFICAAFYTVATIVFFMAFRKHDDKVDVAASCEKGTEEE
jgi:MFS family permease